MRSARSTGSPSTSRASPPAPSSGSSPARFTQKAPPNRAGPSVRVVPSNSTHLGGALVLHGVAGAGDGAGVRVAGARDGGHDRPRVGGGDDTAAGGEVVTGLHTECHGAAGA